MSHHYEKILVAIDGSYESELAFEKRGKRCTT